MDVSLLSKVFRSAFVLRESTTPSRAAKITALGINNTLTSSELLEGGCAELRNRDGIAYRIRHAQ